MINHCVGINQLCACTVSQALILKRGCSSVCREDLHVQCMYVIVHVGVASPLQLSLFSCTVYIDVH